MMNVNNRSIVIEIFNKNVDKIIKKSKRLLKLCDEKNYKLKFNYLDDNISKQKLFWIKNIEKAINIKNIKERYSFIYDTVCEYIDKKYMECNYCDFKDDVCIYFRNNPKIMHKNGCCYSDARGGLCKNLVNNSCSIKSISCKLYSCEYLRKNKINFRMKAIPLIKYFFNIKQKYYIKYSFFKDKDYMINKLIENK
ncbi:MAG: hypothetical protein J6J17_00565 [Bacilli bacterium]|nr:hypothetical protein [Bacilli bacterium]